MKNKFKFSKGRWFINYVSGIPIGVNTELDNSDLGTYSMNIVEPILPDTDEDWEKEKVESASDALFHQTAGPVAVHPGWYPGTEG